MAERVWTATLDDLLTATSRTFALAIPLLPKPTRDTVGLAYLLFRVSDTFEDASSWSTSMRLRAFDEMLELLDASRPDFGDTGEAAHDAARSAKKALRDRARLLGEAWATAMPTEHRGYLALLRATPEVFDALGALEPSLHDIVVTYVRRTTLGMRDVVQAGDGRVELRSIDELRRYCYIVAGIVGELLTAVFLHDAPVLSNVERELLARQRAFGEALQLVNILKDEAEDVPDGRSFLPPGVSRADVVALARDDLGAASTYIETLRRAGAPPGFIAFTALPAELAAANLDVLERRGAGAKVPRAQVLEAFARYRALADGEAPAMAAASR